MENRGALEIGRLSVLGYKLPTMTGALSWFREKFQKTFTNQHILPLISLCTCKHRHAGQTQLFVLKPPGFHCMPEILLDTVIQLPEVSHFALWTFITLVLARENKLFSRTKYEGHLTGALQKQLWQSGKFSLPLCHFWPLRAGRKYSGSISYLLQHKAVDEETNSFHCWGMLPDYHKRLNWCTLTKEQYFPSRSWLKSTTIHQWKIMASLQWQDMLVFCKYHLPEKCLACITLQAWDRWWQNTHNAMSKCNVRRKPNTMPESVAYCKTTEIMLKNKIDSFLCIFGNLAVLS